MQTLLSTLAVCAALTIPFVFNRLFDFILRDRHQPDGPLDQWNNILAKIDKKNKAELKRISKKKKERK